MSEPDEQCEHDWQWLSAMEIAHNSARTLFRGVNAECTKCGARTWAHGRHGNRPIVNVIDTPTTEGN